MSLWKKEYQDKKYKFIDGEHDTPHKILKRKNKKKTPKAKHKHNYRSCVYCWEDKLIGRKFTCFYLGSYCDICGKIGDYRDKENEKRPGFCRSWFLPSHSGGYEAMQWTEEVYPVVCAHPVDQKFIDLEKIPCQFCEE